MQTHWANLELEETWALTPIERKTLLRGKTPANRQVIAALIEFYQAMGRLTTKSRHYPLGVSALSPSSHQPPAMKRRVGRSHRLGKQRC